MINQKGSMYMIGNIRQESDLQSQIDSFQAMLEEAKASGDTETELL